MIVAHDLFVEVDQILIRSKVLSLCVDEIPEDSLESIELGQSGVANLLD